ncbi:MAG: hypothetical protein ACTSU7_00515 [Candidatus Heimdallarchaeaceae archaeon]
MRLLEFIIQNNVPWRIIGKRRKLTEDIKNHLDGIYKSLLEFDKLDLGVKNPFIEILNNNLRMFEKWYWDVEFYKNLVKEYQISHKQNYIDLF